MTDHEDEELDFDVAGDFEEKGSHGREQHHGQPAHRREKSLEPAKAQLLVLNYLKDRFDITREHLGLHELYLAPKGRVYLGPKGTIANPRMVVLGLLIARISGSVKPSTNLLQAFGNRITKNVIHLNKDQAADFAKGSDLLLKGTEQHDDTSNGYVVLKYEQQTLGCGLMQGKTIKNVLPKAKRLELKYL